MSESGWSDTLAINLTGSFLGAKHQIPQMLKNGGGSVIFTSTFVGHTFAFPGVAAYAASKSGLIGLTQALASEFGPSGVRVNAILPGAVDTDMYRSMNNTAESQSFITKVPALADDGAILFDSQAILLHLAEKHQRFVPSSVEGRAELLSWLLFIATGLLPFSGQAVHFLHHAPDALPCARNRYLKEVERHYAILDARLANTRYLAGDEYSIADMALWGWANYAPYILGEQGLAAYPNFKRLFDEISARPAAQRAHGLKDKLTLKAEFDEEIRRALFPQNA